MQSTGSMGQLAAALSDWRRGLAMWRLWFALGTEDITDRYRRTLLGAFWIAGSFALFVGVKVTVFGQMAGVPTVEFGLFVTLGFGLWTFISAIVLDACTAFIHARQWILGVAVPYPVFILQALFRNARIFAFILAVIIVALAWTGTWHGIVPTLSAMAGLATYLVAPVWLGAILAPLCARYRDVYHAIQTGMRLMFFATPILWMPDFNARLAAIARYNPVAHYLEIVREPLLYGTIPVESWTWVLVLNLVGIPLGLAVYAASRRNVVFWV